MDAHARALGAVCCLLATVMWRPVGAENHMGAYGKECSDNTACSGTAPVCAVFFEDFSAREGPSAGDVIRKGMCVECQDDCDCGVNQFCGIDRKSPRTIPTLALSKDSQTKYPYLRSHVDKISNGVKGMRIKSKCYDYSVEGKTCSADTRSPIPEIIDASPLKYANPLGTNVFSPYKVIERKIQRYPAQSAAGSFCGQIESWAPKSREWVGSPNGPTAQEETEALTGIFGTPASCTKQVKASISGADECDYLGAFFTVPKNSCDQLPSTMSCKSACTPPSAYSLRYTDCSDHGASPPVLTDDGEKFCKCVKECNSCVQNNGGCDADSDESDGNCNAECPSDDPGPDPSPSMPNSQYQCPITDTSFSSSVAEIPCKSACRSCLASAMKTSCNCKDRTSTITYDVSFGECSTTGDFEFVLSKGSSDVQASRSFRWYRDNWPKPYSESTLVKVKFHSPAIAWEGYCGSGTCQVCSPYSTRCGRQYIGGGYVDGSYVAGRYVTRGIRQMCDGGKWVTYSEILPGIDRRLVALIFISGIIFLGAHIAIIMTSVLWCILRYKEKNSPRPGESFQQSSHPGTNTTHGVTTASTAFILTQAGPAGTALASTPAPASKICVLCATTNQPNATMCTHCGGQLEGQV